MKTSTVLDFNFVSISSCTEMPTLCVTLIPQYTHISFQHVITARKQSFQRLCFHRCLSVHRGRGSFKGGLCPGWGSLSRVGVSVQGSLSRGSLSRGSLSTGSLSKGSLFGGTLSKGYLSGGSLSMGSLFEGLYLGVFVQGGVSVQGISVQDSCPDWPLSRGVFAQRGVSV